MQSRLDHVAVLVDDLDEATALFARMLPTGAPVDHRLPAATVRFVPAGGTTLELLRLHDDAARRERLDGARLVWSHVAFAVPDLRTRMRDVVDLLAADAPTPTPRGDSVWTDPDRALGLSLQLLERAR